MSQSELRLRANEVEGINAFTSALVAAQGDNLLASFLFGSKARGDAGADSDVDLLIVVDRLEPPIRWQIRELAADCSLEHSLLINTHILDRERWAEHVFYHSTLWREIERDGVALHETMINTSLRR